MNNKDILTPQERIFATENHEEIAKFLRIKHLDYDEWYCIVVPGFLKAVRDYNRNERSKKYPFYVFANRSMMDCVLKEYRAQGTNKRKVNYIAISLESEVKNNTERGDAVTLLSEIVADPNNNIETYIFSDNLKEAITNLSSVQKMIIQKLYEGYTTKEVQQELQLSRRVFEAEMKDIQETLSKCL